MTARWRVVDLSDFSGPISTRDGRLHAGEATFPLADVSCVITGMKTTWSGAFMEAAARYGVAIVACDWRGVPYSAALPWSSNTHVATRHLAQATLSIPRQKNAWKQIVRAKILGQAANLPSGGARDQLMILGNRVRSGDPSNNEAQAAKVYWAHVFEPEHFRRDRWGNGRNSLLNYGYAVIRGVVIRGIITSGLSPTLSLHHRNRANTFALADDLIEPFRPAIDATVKTLPPDASPSDPATKRVLVGILGQPMGATGASVQTQILGLSAALGLYVEGELARLPVPRWHCSDG